MADAADWLLSNRQKEPSGKTGGLFTRDIDLVKFPSEAVGSRREDSRAAVHLLVFACFSGGAEPACNDAPPQAQVQLSFASPSFSTWHRYTRFNLSGNTPLGWRWLIIAVSFSDRKNGPPDPSHPRGHSPQTSRFCLNL